MKSLTISKQASESNECVFLSKSMKEENKIRTVGRRIRIKDEQKVLSWALSRFASTIFSCFGSEESIQKQFSTMMNALLRQSNCDI